MGKHHYAKCFRCGEIAGASHISKAYGCRKCQAKLTKEERVVLHDALIAKNRAQREAEKDVVAFKAQRLERSAADAAPDDVFAQSRAQRRAQGPSEPELQKRDFDRSLVQRLVAEQDYVAEVDKVMSKFSATVRRCACCLTPWHAPEPVYVETIDDKLLCHRCAYGVLRCGWCGIHNNVLYPEIAATTPRVHPRDFPVDVLAPFDAAAFE